METLKENRDSTPPGWTYNPSARRRRTPLSIMAFAGFCIAGYLAAYQWRIVHSVWEPLFGHGSEVVLNSGLSDLLPIPDAALGALAYLGDLLTGAIGGSVRWRSMPWMVLCFGCAAGALGLTSIVLVILQGAKFEAWCTLCLASAALSILMTGPAMEEVLATLQHLRRIQRRGGSVWRAIWGKC